MKALLLAGMAAVGWVGVAQATTFTGSAVGSWSNPSATSSTYTITNNDAGAGASSVASFNFGTPGSTNNTSNLLTFNGVGSGSGTTGFTTMQNTSFNIGAFSYRNGTTTAASYPAGLSTIKLNLALTLTSPTSLTSPFNYNLTIDITPNNTGNSVTDADTVTINNGTTATTFTTGGQLYTLALLGFSSDNGKTFNNTFVAPEQTISNSSLYAQITTNVLPVPEPASFALLGAGLVGVGIIRRRRPA